MTVPSTITFESLANSNMPPAQKSAIRKWYESSMGPGGGNKLALAKLHAKSAGEGIRAGGESLLVGGLLGAFHAKCPTGLDVKKMPVDALAGAIGLVAGTLMAQEEIGKDLQNAGAAALAVYAFRKTNDLVVEAMIKATGITPGGGAALPANLKTITKIDATGAAIHGDAGFGAGWSGPGGSDMGEDPLVRAARTLG
jgi:hypothetical protein